MIGLKTYTKDALRRNEKDFRVPETEADIWLQIQNVEDHIRKLGNNSGKSQLLLQRAKLKKNLSVILMTMLHSVC
jgi:hypothetical protein